MNERAHSPGPGPEPRHPSTAKAGGIFLFLGLLVGAIVGIIYDQPSMGMVGGFALGAAIATIIWLRDRTRG